MNASPEIPVNAETVTWAYRLILGREPESQETVDFYVRSGMTLAGLRTALMASDEFRADREGYREIYELSGAVKSINSLINDTSTEQGKAWPLKGGGEASGRLFFRNTNCNFWPKQDSFASDTFLEDHVLKGWMPEAPSINARTRITTFGSCFAVGIANHLSKLGYSLTKDRDPEIYISRMAEGFVNIHSIAQQFEWALDNKAPPANLWHGFKAEEYGYRDDIRERTRAAFLETDFFIVTLGLSEVWIDEATGGVLWRGVPQKSYDPARHRFRLCTVDETRSLLERIREIVRRHVPGAKLLFTLSPIPLLATFRPVGCVTANAVSKAILRSALDEFYREHLDELNHTLFYFPSYEIAGELFPRRFESDNRHPSTPIVDFIMRTFEAVHCQTGRSLLETNRLFHDRLRANLRALGRE